jgi:hypothetical protein
MKTRLLVAFALTVAAALVAIPAYAHVERPAYWPDPAVDKSVKGGTGGKVPKARSLASALNKKAVGDTRVVCQKGSLKSLKKSIAAARKNGYEIRPSEKKSLSAKQAKRLMALNKKLFQMCRFREIQKAVTKSKNNDRVVIMPGVYVEPTSSRAKTHDPACDKYRTNGDRPGNEGQALSYAYQVNCPNDQNLIAVIGRKVGASAPPMPPRENRHGIPDAGACIRCNLQIEGSGVNADDVVIEAGDGSKGDGGPNGVGSRKDVGIRADRADGFVLKNVKVRHAKEHGIYVLESDGYLLTHFKAYYNGLYGTLTFVEDHGVQERCDAVGHGDSGIYPGAAVETGEQRPAGTAFRYNQEIRFCDLHHNMAGYSGTNGNAVHVHNNEIYDNALGLQTDVVTGAGHPGYPGDSMLIENNNFRSNNFNPYKPESSVKPAFPFPVGTGMWIAGGNRHQVRNNHFYDNWRRGTMLFSVPDFLVCGDAAGGNQQAGCDPNGQTTSFYNSQYENDMGTRPDGTADPNGTDFWWDPYPNTVGNCWYKNRPAKGATITQSPVAPPLPNCNDGKEPSQSVGYGDPNQTGELLSCLASFESRQFDENGPCPWFKTPPEPQPGQSSTPLPVRSASFESPFERQVPVPTDGAINKRNDLSGVSCVQWNYAGEEGRAWLVDKIREFAGGVVNDGERDLGYGNTLTDDQATDLFNDTCPKEYAQGFVLYKLYTYAAMITKTTAGR